jgi:hypothetical protein
VKSSSFLPADISTISWPGHGVFFFWQLGEAHYLPCSTPSMAWP